MKKVTLMVCFSIAFISLIGCSSMGSPNLDGGYLDNFAPSEVYEEELEGEDYLEIKENPFVDTLTDPISTFSLDTSTAGYSNLRRLINQNAHITQNQVKIEDIINYFDYDYPNPAGDDALSISSEIMICPWNPNNKLVSIGVKAREIDHSVKIKNNLVFLLDVSGSMNSSDKLGLMKSAFRLLVDHLNQEDTISIVTYAGSNRVLLSGGKGDEKQRILNIIDSLKASGSTAGANGIQTAYEIASQYFIQDGNNRVILGTDGDFNVGISSTEELKEFISEKRKSNIYFSVLGFGTGNLHDSTMETLAQSGNGNYSYIDCLEEAKKVLVDEIDGTLNAIAKDVKTQVTFNSNYVAQYRLLGYENQLLTDEEFEDEEADAGEIGAGHVTTAVYEIVPSNNQNHETDLGENLYHVVIRYKEPSTGTSKEISKLFDLSAERPTPSEDILFISSLIEFALILRNSEHKANSSLSNVVHRLEQLDCVANDKYKAEFLSLVKKYRKSHQ